MDILKIENNKYLKESGNELEKCININESKYNDKKTNEINIGIVLYNNYHKNKLDNSRGNILIKNENMNIELVEGIADDNKHFIDISNDRNENDEIIHLDKNMDNKDRQNNKNNDNKDNKKDNNKDKHIKENKKSVSSYTNQTQEEKLCSILHAIAEANKSLQNVIKSGLLNVDNKYVNNENNNPNNQVILFDQSIKILNKRNFKNEKKMNPRDKNNKISNTIADSPEENVQDIEPYANYGQSKSDNGKMEQSVQLLIIQEIHQTEVEYVQNLCMLLDNYLIPMEEEKISILEDPQVAVFFNTLRQLLTINSKFLDDLTELIKTFPEFSRNQKNEKTDEEFSMSELNRENDMIKGIGILFCRFAPLFKLYAGYGKDYNDVRCLLQKYKDDPNSGLLRLLERSQFKSSSARSFESLLILPIQRIPRYKMLLERAAKISNNVDLYLKEAIEKTKTAAVLLNETIRFHENMERLLAEEQKFGGNLVLFNKTRLFIKYGKLIKVSRKRPEEVMIHLFTDLLIYSDISITGSYRLRRSIDLKSKSCHIDPNIPVEYSCLIFNGHQLDYSCGFMITSQQKSFLLFAPSIIEKKEWVHQIANAIKTQHIYLNDQNDKFGKPSPEKKIMDLPEDPAAFWIPDSAAGCCAICKTNFTMIFRRHHCRRCGAVVCRTCSGKRISKIAAAENDSNPSKRVCNKCFRLLTLVKSIARKWLSKINIHEGWLKFRRWHKWSDNYFELKSGVLKMFSMGPDKRPLGTQPIDIKKLAGASVLHLSENSRRHPYSFQITNHEHSNYGGKKANKNLDGMCDLKHSNEQHDLNSDDVISSPPGFFSTSSSRYLRNQLFKSPEIRPGEDGDLTADDFYGLQFNNISSVPSKNGYTHAIGLKHVSQSTWILAAKTADEEVAWTVILQREACIAAEDIRKVDHDNTTQISTNDTAITPKISSMDGINEFVRGMSISTNTKYNTKINEQIYSLHKQKQERKRYYILHEIVRSEKNYVNSLGDCMELFVQPLLLDQQAIQKAVRQKKNKKNHIRSSLRKIKSAYTVNKSIQIVERKKSNAKIDIRKVSYSSFPTIEDGDQQIDSATFVATNTIQEPVALDADMAIFFNSIEQIYTLNNQLLDHLSINLEELSKSDSNSIVRAGAIFNSFAPLFKLYTAYASRHEAVLSFIENTPNFLSFMDEKQEKYSMNRLRTYLNMPMQNIPRYKMFLQDLKNVTERDHLDYSPLVSAVQNIDAVISQIHDNIQKRENKEKIMSIEKKYMGTIDLRGRFYIKEGFLKKVCRKHIKNYHFVLFSDALMYGHAVGAASFKHHRTIELDECKATEITDIPPVMTLNAAGIAADQRNYFCFLSPSKSFILVASSKENRDSWLLLIKKYIGAKTRNGSQLDASFMSSAWSNNIDDTVISDENIKRKKDDENSSSCHIQEFNKLSNSILDNVKDNNDNKFLKCFQNSNIDISTPTIIRNGWINLRIRESTKIRKKYALLIENELLLYDNEPTSLSLCSMPKPGYLHTKSNERIDKHFDNNSDCIIIKIQGCKIRICEGTDRFFRIMSVPSQMETVMDCLSNSKEYMIETDNQLQRNEWVRAIRSCIENNIPEYLNSIRRSSAFESSLAPVFMYYKESKFCTVCNSAFAIYRRRHYCKSCGALVCSNCSKNKKTLANRSTKGMSRVCDHCHEQYGKISPISMSSIL